MEQVKERSLSDVLSTGRRMSVYEKTALKLLAGLKKGSLTVTLSDGTIIKMGEEDSLFKATLHVNNPDMFRKSILYGDVGFGESYVDGDWDTDSITNFISWWILNYENNPSLSGSKRKFSPMGILQMFDRFSHRFRSNTKTGSQKNISEHYDLSNDFYSLWLDETMTYSSGLFRNKESTLPEAQFEKYDRLCRKISLNSNDHLLEIGTGWGGFAIHAVKHYGCKVTTITISKEQFDFAKARFEREGVAESVELLLKDYRDIEGTYDKLVSIEMIEAVGHEFLETYFSKCQRLVKRNGLMAIQAITSPDSRYDEFRTGVDWIQKHIFPGSLLPSIGAMNAAINTTGDMHLIDLKDFGMDYARTLSLWRDAFNKRIGQIKELGFDERFIRKWNYYLSYCEAGFTMKNISVVQAIYTRPNNIHS